MTAMTRIGFVGLGIMGRPMCRNLLKAGHALVVYDIVAGAMAEIVSAGATPGESDRPHSYRLLDSPRAALATPVCTSRRCRALEPAALVANAVKV